MNFIDLILIIPLIWFGFKGFRKGFIIEVASLAALLLGIYGGIKLSGIASQYISQWFEINSEYLPLISFSVVFILILIIVFLIAHLIDRVVKTASLGLLNRLAGALFGMSKILIIIGIILIMINNYDSNNVFIKKETKDNSLLYNPLSKFVSAIFPSIMDILKTKDAPETGNPDNN